jgi:hypothetical protein
MIMFYAKIIEYTDYAIDRYVEEYKKSEMVIFNFAFMSIKPIQYLNYFWEGK